MHTNGDITIYNAYYDVDSRTDKYKRTVIENVYVEERLGSNRLKSGLESADKLLVLIPVERLETYVSAKEFKGANNTFTFKLGDRVVKNRVTYEVIDTTSELDRQFETFTITSIDIRDQGNYKMQHIELGAK